MRSILFDPESSTRRALILALGAFDADQLAQDERDRIVRRLLELYRDDPDAGIHGAAEWTLRQWMQQEKLEASIAELNEIGGRENRRWFVNGQGQTFAAVDGPVEFKVGSPGSEPDRSSSWEFQRSVSIPRRFAVGTHEVTVEQFQRFLRAKARTEAASRYPATILAGPERAVDRAQLVFRS